MAIYAPSLDEIQKALSGEGVQTWTPELWDAGLADDGATYNTTNTYGEYIRIGKFIYVAGRMTVTGLGTLTTSDAALVGGLPFDGIASRTPSLSVGLVSGMSLGTAGRDVKAYINGNVGYISLRLSDVTTGNSDLLISEFSATGDITFSGWYMTNDAPA